MSPVEAYLAELSKRLVGSLPKDVAEARLREVRTHLVEAVGAEGRDAALRRFGTPAANARAIVRQVRGYDARGTTSLSWVVGLALAAAFSVSTIWSEHAMTITAVQVSVWTPFLAVLFFAWRCLQTRRWLAIPVAGWGALGIGAIFVVLTLLPPRIEAKKAESSIASARSMVAQWDRNAREVAAWRSGTVPTNSAPYFWRSPTTSYIAGLPFEIHSMSEPIYDLARHDGPQPFARKAWRDHGEGWAREVAVRQKEAAAYLAAQEAGLARVPPPFGEQARAWLLAAAQAACVLFAFNALALLAGCLLDHRASRPRWAR